MQKLFLARLSELLINVMGSAFFTEKPKRPDRSEKAAGIHSTCLYMNLKSKELK